MKSTNGLAAKGTTGTICSAYHYRQRLRSSYYSSGYLEEITLIIAKEIRIVMMAKRKAILLNQIDRANTFEKVLVFNPNGPP